MEPQEFFDAVLGNTGWYCTASIEYNNGHGSIKEHLWSSSRDEIEINAEDVEREGCDAYFALSTYKDPTTAAEENRPPRGKASTIELKSFFIELDCGTHVKTGKQRDYASKKDGLIALQKFIKALDLPKPIIVDSGGGIHVYWVLNEPVDSSLWVGHAKKLQQACAENDLRVDSQITTDPARIMRVPNTDNKKMGSDNPRPVKIISGDYKPVDLETFSSKLGDQEVKPVLELIKKLDNVLMVKLMGNREHRFVDILARSAEGKGCAQIENIFRNQEGLEEPLWRAGLSIANVCSDRDIAIHKMSHNYENYDPNETEKKASETAGPYTCATFKNLKAELCEGCPYQGKITSPIQLGEAVLRAEGDDNIIPEAKKVSLPPQDPNVIPPYPSPYFRGKAGGIYREVLEPDEDGKLIKVGETCIYHNDLYAVRRLVDPEMGECIVLNLVLPQDGVRPIIMPLRAAASREEIKKLLSMAGVLVTKWEPLMKYIETWVNELQERGKADDSRRQFGWADNYESFIIGDREITKNGIRINHATPATAMYFGPLSVKGTVEGWREMVMPYSEKGLHVHQLVVAQSFGSILTPFLPDISATILHIWTVGSGFGKTFLKNAALSVWGNPRSNLRMKGKDTENAIMYRAEVFKNLPIMIDEWGQAKPEVIASVSMTMTDGMQRDRLSNSTNAARYRGEPWALSVFTSGNFSLIDKITTVVGTPMAEAQRVLEVDVRDYDYFNKRRDAEEATKFTMLMESNYGLVGQMFVEYVIANIEEVRTEVSKIQDELMARFGLVSENRFWAGYMSTAIVANRICSKLEIMDFKEDDLLVGADLMIEQNKQKVKNIEADPASLINDFVNDNYRNIIYINSSKDRRGNTLTTKVLDDLNRKIDPVNVMGRYEPDVDILSIRCASLRDWCAKKNINYTGMVSGLSKEYSADPSKMVRLTKGLDVDIGANSRCLVVNCRGFLEMGGFKKDNVVSMKSSEDSHENVETGDVLSEESDNKS